MRVLGKSSMRSSVVPLDICLLKGVGVRSSSASISASSKFSSVTRLPTTPTSSFAFCTIRTVLSWSVRQRLGNALLSSTKSAHTRPFCSASTMRNRPRNTFGSFGSYVARHLCRGESIANCRLLSRKRRKSLTTPSKSSGAWPVSSSLSSRSSALAPWHEARSVYVGQLELLGPQNCTGPGCRQLSCQRQRSRTAHQTESSASSGVSWRRSTAGAPSGPGRSSHARGTAHGTQRVGSDSTSRMLAA
mmetsp:Transcript_29150/g.81883  ORF Transcript_29150/g.81883 Transcript_29150/m.81883 type:complete len:246 (-) Transcript_29150:550-1287(-)